MCLVCLEYIKGNLTADEFRRNIREYSSEDHNDTAIALASFEMAIDSLEEKTRKD